MKNLFAASVLFAAGLSGCASASEPAVSRKSLTSGNVTVYDYGELKLHAGATNDPLNDQWYILESRDALVGIELPPFRQGLEEWKSYLHSLGKPMSALFVDAHPAGGSYAEGITVYSTEAAEKAIAGGSTASTTAGLYAAFGEDFRGNDIAAVGRTVSGAVTAGGIRFNVIGRGDTYDLEIPDLKLIYTHMLGGKVHSILPGAAAAEEMLKTCRGYQKAGYDMILSGHCTPEGQEAVAEKIAYLETAEKIMRQCSTSEEFISAMKEKFPDYEGENYLRMSAGFLYPQTQK
ncbi:MAG: hypothetical protein ACI4NN_02470 [Pyramidobacter sp.]|jgi:hypothetical protein